MKGMLQGIESQLEGIIIPTATTTTKDGSFKMPSQNNVARVLGSRGGKRD
jgi:hypothetical protein